MNYPILEPNHEVRFEDGLQVVYCPFEVTSMGGVILHESPVTLTITYSLSAGADEIECPVCEVLDGRQLHFLGAPDCEGTGEESEV
jgi:hypothetical protein